MNVTSIIIKGYENKSPIWVPKKQSQTSKRQKPMQPYLPKRIMKETRFWASKKQTQLVLRSLWRRRKQTQPVVSLPALLALSEVEGSLPKRAQSKGSNLFQNQNDTGPHIRCYKATATFTKINLNRNYFLVNPLYQVRKTRLIKRVDFLKHRLLTHIRIAFRIVQTKVKVYTLCWPLYLLFDVSDKAKHKAFFRTFRYEFCTNTILNNNL
jgi:hypothetical protein